MSKKEKNKNSKIKIFIVAIIIIIVLFLVIKLIATKNITFKVDNLKVSLTYSSFDYKESQKKENETKLVSKEDEINVKISKDSDTEYEILKEYKKMVYNGEEKQFKNNSFLIYKNESANQYELIAPIKNNTYIEIYVSAKENSNKTLEEIIKQKKIQNFLDSFKVEK